MLRYTLLVALAACTLYTDDPNPPPPPPVCNGIAIAPYRDPQTGQCTSTSCGCGQACPEIPADVAPCDTACLGLGEASCLGAKGCQAEYLGTSYWGCFAVAPSGPIEGTCTGLDAYDCSRHDDCKAYYDPIASYANDVTAFDHCAPETPPPACDMLGETDCKARTDCDAVYDGSDCTCDPSGCTCKTETFARCEAR